MTGFLPIGIQGDRSRRTISRIVATASVALAAMFCATASRAQQSIVFDHLSVNQGLSQASVMCAFQDSRGFMWFGTQDGLNRYDGYAFRVYKHDPADPRSINGNFITAISEGSDGTVLVETLNDPGMVNRFERTSETFSEVPRDSVDMVAGRVSAVHPSYKDTYGGVWTGDIRAGLTRLDSKTGKKTVFRHDSSNPRSLIDDRVYSVVGDHAGAIWIGTHEGLDRFDRETESFIHYRHDDRDPNSLSDNWVWPIAEDRAGILWVGTFRGGLNRLDRATGTFTRFRHDDFDPRSLSDNRIYSLYVDRTGMIWAGTGEHGADHFTPGRGAFFRYTHIPSDPSSLVNDNIIALYVDRSGRAWIGTHGGLDRMENRFGRFMHFKHDPGDPRSIGDNLVQSILEDRHGMLWFGTVSSGLDMFDVRTGVFRHFRHDPVVPHGISDNSIATLCEDRRGNLWLGSYTGGIDRLDSARSTFTHFEHADSLPGSLGGHGVWAILEDHDGTLWVGTSDQGLDRFNPETETFTHFRHDDTNAKSLSDNSVVCLQEDHSGTLWVGTSGGLNKFDRSTGTFTRYRQKEGLANDFVFGILEDGSGDLWITTNKGLSRFDPRTGRFRTYDYNDGLQGNEFNQSAYARSSLSGEIYVGGANGFNVFHPDSVRKNPDVPPVAFTSFTRYNSDDKEGKPIEEKGIDAKQGITISYKDDVANFEFAALNYYNTFRNEYAYKLEGYSSNWIQLGTDHRATFTNLDGGEYTLRVKGSNNDGVWNEVGASLRITVLPPWWKTKWAYGTYVVLFLSGLYGLRGFEINRQRQKAMVRESELRATAAEAQQRALEAENARKTKELEDARRLQLSLLPKDVPQLPEYEIAVYMRTATEVGGDYYDFTRAGDGTLIVGFGDATGHGMQAGTIVTLMKGLFVSDAPNIDIQTFFAQCSNTIKDIRLGRLFMAFTLLRLKGSSVSFSCAGMPPVFLYRREAKNVDEILLKGMPLGAMRNFPYAVFDAQLSAGDTLLLLSDGLPEQKNARGEMLDYARVQTAFAEVAEHPPDEIISHLNTLGEAWMGNEAQDDDVTMMVIRMKS